MTDNTQLNAGTGGDSVRTVAKTANSPAKTQVNVIDVGGGADGSAETPLTAGTAGSPSAVVLSVQGVASGTAVPVSAAALPLPAGAATAAGLTTINTTLGSPFQAGASIGNSSFGATQSGSWTVAATQSGTWSAGRTWSLASGSDSVTATISGTVPVSGTFWQTTQPVSAASLPLPTGASTSANQPAINGDGGALAHVTNFPSTQAISAASLPLPSGAGTAANQTTINATLGTLALETGGNLATVASKISGTLATSRTWTLGGATDSVALLDAPSNITGSATSAAVLFTQDTTGYNSISVQVTNPGTTCTITYEGSNDNSTWFSIMGLSAGAPTTTYPASTGTATITVFPTLYRYFRARVSTYTSGTVTVSAYLRQTPVQVMNVVSAAQSGNWSIGAGTNGMTTGSAVAPATPAAVSVKGTAGRWFWFMVGNSGASDVWVKGFNSASVTLGTTSATLNLYVPKGTTQTFVWADFGNYNSTALQYAVTGGISLTDNTSITASTVTVNYAYI